jgi:hypothetical protein
MKKLTTILAAVAMIISTSAFAGTGVNVTEKVDKAFKENFTGATNVTWTKTNDFYFAHFEMNNDDVSVAYNEDGDLLGTSHLINQSALPQAVTYSLKEKYDDFKISPSVTEVELLGKISYFITLETRSGIVRLKCSDAGTIAVEKTTKKPALVGKVY